LALTGRRYFITGSKYTSTVVCLDLARDLATQNIKKFYKENYILDLAEFVLYFASISDGTRTAVCVGTT
jgi:hypothetical protein